MVNNMSLNIDIDVANLAVARLKCMLQNWDKLASVVVGDDSDFLVLDEFSVDVTNGLCDVFDNAGLDWADYTCFYKSWVDVFIKYTGAPNLVYPVDGPSEYYEHANLYANPKRKALAEWCLQCLEEYVAEHEH